MPANYIKWYLLPFIYLSLAILPAISHGDPAKSHNIILKEGKNYTVLDTPVQESDNKNKESTTVKEFFLFQCSHCYHFNDHLKNWVKHQSSKITFSQIPVFYDGESRVHARLFYSIKKLGIYDKAFPVIFKGIQEGNKNLNSEAGLKQYMQKHFDIDPKQFQKVYRSSAVTEKMDAGFNIIKAIQLKSVPTLLIGGKYLVNPEMAGGAEEMLAITDLLIKKSRSQKTTHVK